MLPQRVFVAAKIVEIVPEPVNLAFLKRCVDFHDDHGDITIKKLLPQSGKAFIYGTIIKGEASALFGNTFILYGQIEELFTKIFLA